MTQHTEQNEIDYWNGEWIVGTEVLVTDGDWSIGWGKIIEISKDDPYWSKVELEDGKIVDAYKMYCYKKNKEKPKENRGDIVPSINTADGEAFYVRTDIEDENEKWEGQNLTIKDGFWIIHNGNEHYIYQIKGEQK